MIRIRREGSGFAFDTRGDAQERLETVPSHAVFYRVDRVEHPRIRYDTRGPLGRLIARLALRGGLPWAALKTLTRLGGRILKGLGPQ